MLPEQFAPIFDAIVEGAFIFDASGRIMYMNEAAKRILALIAPAGSESLPLEERIRLGQWHTADGTPLAAEASPPQRVLHGETLNETNMPDVFATTHEGQEVAFSFSGVPIRDASGAITGAVLLTRDVTDRHQLERRTQDALDALLSMAEALMQPNGESGNESGTIARRLALLTCDVLGCRRVSISLVDPASGLILPFAVAGLSPEQEAFYWEYQRNTATRLEDIPNRALMEAMRAGEIMHIDFDALPADQPNPYDIRDMLIVPLRISDHFIGSLALDHGSVAHDYTAEERRMAGAVGKLLALVIERDRLWQQREAARAEVLALEAANQRMDEFLSIASHELRTPLTIIKANVQMTQRALSDYLRQRPDLEPRFERLIALFCRTDQHVNRLDRLVEDLLDESRIQSGRLHMHVAPCDLAQIAREAVEEQHGINPSRVITLQLPEEDGPVMIEADAMRMSQVVTNFLTNALKYSPPEAPVEARLRVLPGLARVEVQDHGPGLRRNQQARVWERFYRAPEVVVQQGSSVGMGLGLFICKTIIERHGGSVGVKSALGQGATFWFQVPLLGAVPQPKASTMPPRRLPRRSRKAKHLDHTPNHH